MRVITTTEPVTVVTRMLNSWKHHISPKGLIGSKLPMKEALFGRTLASIKIHKRLVIFQLGVMEPCNLNLITNIPEMLTVTGAPSGSIQ